MYCIVVFVGLKQEEGKQEGRKEYSGLLQDGDIFLGLSIKGGTGNHYDY